MTRRHPEFEPGIAVDEAAQLEKIERYRRVQIQQRTDVVKNLFSSLVRYKLGMIHDFLIMNKFEYRLAQELGMGALGVSSEKVMARSVGFNPHSNDHYKICHDFLRTYNHAS